MTWAGKRKLLIVSIIVLVLAIIAGGIGYLTFHKPASCSDGVQNQKEDGIDCGGSCSHLCVASQAALSVRFARALSPLPGRTDVIAYIDNPNTTSAAENAPYTIELYNDQNVLVSKASGIARLPALSTIPLFVPNLFSGAEQVSHVFVTIGATEVTWVTGAPLPKSLQAENIVFTPGTSPRVTADIHNLTVQTKTNVPFVVTLFGADGKALAASKTVLDTVAPQNRNSVVFTWPTPIGGAVTRIEILPLLGP